MPKNLDEADTGRWPGDCLIDIGGICQAFKIGRTAAYELTHRREFPDPVILSPRCYRWWASEVAAFAASLQQRPARRARRTWSDRRRPAAVGVPARITGTVREPARGRRAAP